MKNILRIVLTIMMFTGMKEAYARSVVDIQQEIQAARHQLQRLQAEKQSHEGQLYNIQKRVDEYSERKRQTQKQIDDMNEAISAWEPGVAEGNQLAISIVAKAKKAKSIHLEDMRRYNRELSAHQKELRETRDRYHLVLAMIPPLQAGLKDLEQELAQQLVQTARQVINLAVGGAGSLGVPDAPGCQQ